MFNRLNTYLVADTPAFSLLQRIYKGLLALATGTLLIFVLAWPFPRNTQYQQLSVGDVVQNDIVSPIRKSFDSEILTTQAQDRAMEAVAPVYDPPSRRTRRQQTDVAREVLDFITIVRQDLLATEETRTDYLDSIYNLELSQEEILSILTLSEEEWQQVSLEVPLALDRVMRDEIHNNEGALASARRSVPRLIGGELSDSSTEITSALVGDLIVPNSFRNEESTLALRNQAAEAVEPLRRSFEQGENVIRRNTKITAEDLEALEQLGLLQTEWSWWTLVRAIVFAVVLMAVVLIAVFRLVPELLGNTTQLSLLALATGIWLLTAKFMIIPHPWLPYLYPLATLGMLISVLIDLRVAVIVTLAFTLVVVFLGNASDVFVVFLGMSSLFGALILGRAERLTAFLWTGVVVVASNLLVYAAFRLPFQEIITASQLQDFLLLTLNGLLSASIALLGYFVLGNLFGLTTSLQLTELSRPTHPLLRQLLLKSPGTYHHTIVVSNMAERAAAAIGADAMLTRVGAYYHDIGKTVRPYFFIENSADGAESPHAKLDPLTSAQIIISHVTDGIDLAQKYKLPGRIQDFIREHHGESVIRSFYIPALEAAEAEGKEISEDDFRYAGPSPRTKETAILMLADTCESAVRAIRPNTRREMAELIDRLIDNRVNDGDLNQCNLTFRELQEVKEIFGQVLQGVHHPRVSYPTLSGAENEASTDADAEIHAQTEAEVEVAPDSEINSADSASLELAGTMPVELPDITAAQSPTQPPGQPPAQTLAQTSAQSPSMALNGSNGAAEQVSAPVYIVEPAVNDAVNDSIHLPAEPLPRHRELSQPVPGGVEQPA